jgi:hypothetical protein
MHVFYLNSCALYVSIFIRALIMVQYHKILSKIICSYNTLLLCNMACPGDDSAPTTTPKWCLCLATTFFGQKLGLAVLEGCSRSSFFFIWFGRIFYYLRMATSISAKPSGHVPGVGRDGNGWRWNSSGAHHGLDCVFESACRVLCAKALL